MFLLWELYLLTTFEHFHLLISYPIAMLSALCVCEQIVTLLSLNTVFFVFLKVAILLPLQLRSFNIYIAKRNNNNFFQ